MKKYTKLLSDLSLSDRIIAGGKGASLGEMIQHGINIPNGFVILSDAFTTFINSNNLHQEINSQLDCIYPDDTASLDHVSDNIQKLILDGKIPQNILAEINNCYTSHCDEFIAIRSSATMEDGMDATWAGQLKTYLNTTEKNLILNIKKCWASLYSPSAIAYSIDKKINNNIISVAVIVQNMLESDFSGVAFSADPISLNPDHILIEACVGLGEALVSGEITPDRYYFSKVDSEVFNKEISQQVKKLIRDTRSDSNNKWVSLDESESNSQFLNDMHILELSKLVIEIEKIYKTPQDIEWTFVNNELFITQSRPITTLGDKERVIERLDQDIISSFMSNNSTGEIYNFTLDTLPLFWVNPLVLLDQELEKQFVPTLCIWKNNSLHLYMNTDEFIGISKKLLKHYTQGNKHYIDRINMLFAQFKNDSVRAYDDFFATNEDKSTAYLIQKLDETLTLFKDFLTSTSVTYIGEKEILEVATKINNIQVENIQKGMIHDIHHTHEYYQRKEILNHLESKTSDLSTITFAFTDYTQVPSLIAVEQNISSFNIETLKDEIGEIEGEVAEKNVQYSEFLKDLNTDEIYFLNFIQLIKNNRDERKYYFMRVLTLMKSISDMLLKKWDVKGKDNIFVHELLRGKEYVECLNLIERENSFAVHFDAELAPTLGVITSDVTMHFDKIEHLKLGDIHNTFTGTIAHPGNIIGNAVVVLNKDDYYKINKGDILITSMTRPEITPYLNNVSAIITDEGGVTCHAAIISREKQKPCVIGTRIATQIIKTGDLIEICSDGVINILKNK